MEVEDYRSKAMELMRVLHNLRLNLGWNKEELSDANLRMKNLEELLERDAMTSEDF